MNRFISLFLILFLSFPIFSSTNSVLIGDLTKDELFIKDKTFYKNYLSAEPYQLNEAPDIDGISVKILFGTWCHDSQREIPKLLKLLEDIGMQSEMISLIGLNYNKNEPLNRGEILKLEELPQLFFIKMLLRLGE